MALLTYCINCQYGDHDGHYEVVQAVPEGVMGGAICKCKGECRDFPQPTPVIATLPELSEDVAALLRLAELSDSERVQ